MATDAVLTRVIQALEDGTISELPIMIQLGDIIAYGVMIGSREFAAGFIGRVSDNVIRAGEEAPSDDTASNLFTGLEWIIDKRDSQATGIVHLKDVRLVIGNDEDRAAAFWRCRLEDVKSFGLIEYFNQSAAPEAG